MKFTAQHRFSAPPEVVSEVLLDPDFYRSLELPDVGRPEVVSADPSAGRLELRYEFEGHLDPMAERLLGRNRLRWLQTIELDRTSGRGRLHFEAEASPGRLHGDADFTLEADGARTVQRLEGEIVVAVPGIGRMAERRIVPGVVRRLDLEADALQARLEEGRPAGGG